jgi:hypothetical protein
MCFWDLFLSLFLLFSFVKVKVHPITGPEGPRGGVEV